MEPVPGAPEEPARSQYGASIFQNENLQRRVSQLLANDSQAYAPAPITEKTPE